eukprot:CAMPEP_0202704036 /NCGR_PEP_ID=MMETSP1385-20130828/16799_1 /ASSEMBLY_ACC=CAM_ASM_000861 /TAXON_ID=933848 /ORGANISM="Elphidium margaritaceum" /LENGTH=44 /DNA_ID= /DNA_START= /DNA_END= /DNA_ORIENTATION=
MPTTIIIAPVLTVAIGFHFIDGYSGTQISIDFIVDADYIAIGRA